MSIPSFTLRRSWRHNRQGSLIVDVLIALLVFTTALTAFLALANQKGRMLEDTARYALAYESAETWLVELGQKSDDALLEFDGVSKPVPGYPGRGASIEFQVVPGLPSGTLRVDAVVHWVATDGHRRELSISQYRASHGLHEGEKD